MAKEIGYAVAHRNKRAAEDNWELTWPRSVRMYSKMTREDAQVKSVLNAVTGPIKRTTWRVDPNGADERIVRMVAEDLNLPVKGEEVALPYRRSPRRVSWKSHLARVLRWTLTYGHAYFELVFDDATETEDGMTHLRKIAPRHPASLSKINVAEDGGLESIEQYGKLEKSVTIPVKNLLAYLHEDDDDLWVGESMFRAAYKHWILKDEFLRLEQLVLDRNGMGVPVATASDFAEQQEVNDLQALAEGLRSGEASGAALKHGQTLDIKGVSGQLVSPRDAITYHDAQIARTALAHALNLEGKGGSYALADVQMALFFQNLNQIAQTVADTANQYLVRDMVDAYTGEVDAYPLIEFDTIESIKMLTPNDLATLANAGVIFMDATTEDHVRRQYEMPPKERGEFAPPPGTTGEMADVERRVQLNARYRAALAETARLLDEISEPPRQNQEDDQ